jgi:ribonuclease E
MAKRMLIDATHPEETRVAVVDGRRLEEFDVEVASKKQLKGNIYLAKITRVEPSLQAAFVEYGGNRHGFLAFSEIHPDYYRIPLEDREALLAEQAAMAREQDEQEEGEDRHRRDRHGRHRRDHGGRGDRHRNESQAGDSHDGDSQSGDSHGEEHHDGDSRRGDPHDQESHGDALPEEIRSEEPRAEDAAGSDATEDGRGNTQALEAGGQSEFRLSSEPFEPEASSEPARESGPAAEWPAAPAGDETARGEPESTETGLPETAAGFDDAAPAEESGDATHADDGQAVAQNVAAEEAPEHRAVIEKTPPVPQALETVGGDEAEESSSRRSRPLSRRYKIQDVIKRRQILLVQVTKEERGNKGAALTTYLSLAGRYCVLMPNTDRGGGVSRKITNAGDRKRLKTIIEDLELPAGMAVIVRTAGSERSKPEVKRDFEYLIRLWDEIRELTLRSTAPALIYEEANLIKRAIRDLYTRDIEDIQVEGDEAYRAAKSFMRMLTPSHAKRVQQYKDPTMPLFTRYQIESQLDAIHNPVVQLKSGGYVVINRTEALVAIDVNSGRATRERNIEETAAKTNLEASDEIARQLRLRDLAGLVVIDYIDMDESRHNAQVERRLKDAMRHDRARIQLGRISPFGLLELSRQRLRPSLFEASTEVCRLCRGTGHVRSTESTALHVLRSIDEEGARQKSAAITVSVPAAVALFILNHKRQSLAELEIRQGFRIYLGADETLVPPEFRIERLKALAPGDAPPAPVVQPTAPTVEAEAEIVEEEEIDEEEMSEESAAEPREDSRPEGQQQPQEAREQGSEQGDGDRGRRRRRRRRGRDRHGPDGQRDGQRDQHRDGDREPRRDHDRMASPPPASFEATGESIGEPAERVEGSGQLNHEPGRPPADGGDPNRRRRRRGRRGGRRRRRGGEMGDGSGTSMNGEREQGGGAPAFTESNPSAGSEESEQHWPEQRPMTPADFDRPFAPEPAEHRHTDVRPMPERAPEPVAERAVETRVDSEPTSAPATEAGENSSGERKRGWWKRVLS